MTVHAFAESFSENAQVCFFAVGGSGKVRLFSCLPSSGVPCGYGDAGTGKRMPHAVAMVGDWPRVKAESTQCLRRRGMWAPQHDDAAAALAARKRRRRCSGLRKGSDGGARDPLTGTGLRIRACGLEGDGAGPCARGRRQQGSLLRREGCSSKVLEEGSPVPRVSPGVRNGTRCGGGGAHESYAPL